MSALSTDSNSNVSIYQQAIALGTQFNATENWHFLVGGCYSKVKYDRWMINNKTQCQTYQSLYQKQKLVPYAGIAWDFMP